MKITMIWILLVMLGVGCLALEATPNSLAVSFGIQELVVLDVDSIEIDFGTVDPENSPFQQLGATHLTVQSNAKNNWTLQTYATGDLVSREDNDEIIPLSQFKFKGGDITDFTSLSTTPTTIRTGTPGTANVTIDYQLTITYDDAAVDGYQTIVTYELVAD